MSFAEELRAAHIERRKRLWECELPTAKIQAEPLDMAGPGTGSMWCGLNLTWFKTDDTRSADRIIAAVIEETHVHYRDLIGPWRTRSFSRARQIAYFLMRQHTNLSLPAIGMRIGDRHHTTVLSGVRCVNRHPHLFEPQLSNVMFRLGLGEPRNFCVH